MLTKLLVLPVLACWPLYIALFVRRPARPKAETRRDPAALFGILLQFSAVVLVWVWRRPLFSGGSAALYLVALIAAIAAVDLSRRALAALGENWNFVASVGHEHRLIQHGPYGVIRHPLYMCFGVLTLATAVVWSQPLAIVIATPIYLIGVWIRIRTEENLLRKTFGKAFDAYCERVPGMLPLRLKRRV